MNNINLGYLGEVTLKYIVKDKVISLKKKNNGTIYLFESIANYLANKNETSNFKGIPDTLDIRYVDDANKIPDDENSKSILKQEYSIPIVLSEVEKITDTSNEVSPAAVIHYQSVINYSYLSTSRPEDAAAFYICLYSTLVTGIESQVRKMLAYIKVEEQELNLIQPGTQAILTWDITINNKSTT